MNKANILILAVMFVLADYSYSQNTTDDILQSYLTESKKFSERRNDFTESTERYGPLYRATPKSQVQRGRLHLLLNDAQYSFKNIYGTNDYLSIVSNIHYTTTLLGKSQTDINLRLSTKLIPLLAKTYDSSISFQRWNIISANTIYANKNLYDFLPEWIWEDWKPCYEASSWVPMSVYSFKEDSRAQEVLFDLFVSNKMSCDLYWSGLYLTFIDSPDKMLAKSKGKLRQQLENLRKISPEIGSHVEKELPQLSGYSELRDKLKLLSPLTKEEIGLIKKIIRLKILTNVLEFHTRIPEKEYQRYTIFLRELALSHALSCKVQGSRFHPGWYGIMKTNLKKGDEQFEIYAQQTLCILGKKRDFGYVVHYTYDLTEPELLVFYVNQLAHPRLKYTDIQMDYMKSKIKKLQYNIKYNAR